MVANKNLNVTILGDAKDLSRELKKAAGELDKFGDDVEKSGIDFGGKLSGALSAAGTAIAVAAAAVAVVVGAAFMTALSEVIEDEQIADMVTAQLNLAETEAVKAAEVIENAYTDAFGETKEEVANAYTEMARFHGEFASLTVDQQGDMVEGALAIADVYGQDVSEVIRGASALVRNDLAPTWEAAFDLITTGFTENADYANDFIDTLTEYSPHIDGVGLTAQEFFNVLNAGFEEGIWNTDLLGDAFKEFRIIMLEDSERASDALDELNLDYDELSQAIADGGPAAREATGIIIEALGKVEDDVVRNQLGVELFGTKFEDLGPQAAAVLGAIEDDTGEVRSTTDLASDAYDNLGTSIEMFKRKGKNALGEFLSAFLEAMGVDTGGDRSLKGAIDSLNTWIDENEETIREWGEEAAAFVTNAVNWFNNDLIPVLEDILGFITEIRDVWTWLNRDISAKPNSVRMLPTSGGSSWDSVTDSGIDRYHSGGVVPGMPGQEVLAILEAGEKVIPADRSGSQPLVGEMNFYGTPEHMSRDVSERISLELRLAG